MKMQEKVAGNFMKARGIKADYGDTVAYFNTFDYLKTTDGSQMNPDQVRESERIMNEAISDSFRVMDAALQKALRKLGRKLAKAGLEVK